MAAQLTPAYRTAYEKVEAARKEAKYRDMTAADVADALGVRKAYYYTAKSLIKKEREVAAAGAATTSTPVKAVVSQRPATPARAAATSTQQPTQRTPITVKVITVTGDADQVAEYMQSQGL